MPKVHDETKNDLIQKPVKAAPKEKDPKKDLKAAGYAEQADALRVKPQASPDLKTFKPCQELLAPLAREAQSLANAGGASAAQTVFARLVTSVAEKTSQILRKQEYFGKFDLATRFRTEPDEKMRLSQVAAKDLAELSAIVSFVSGLGPMVGKVAGAQSAWKRAMGSLAEDVRDLDSLQRIFHQEGFRVGPAKAKAMEA